MFLCLAMCFSAYASGFSDMKNFETKIFFQKKKFCTFFFLKSCGSLTAAVQGGTFSFALSIPFIALPMHCSCTIYQADPGHFVSVVHVDKHFPTQRH